MAELGAGSGTGYPGVLDTDNTLESTSTVARSNVPNDLAAAIIAIQTELGIDPAGSLTDLKTRLAVGINDDGTLKGSSLVWITKTGTYTAANRDGVMASTSGGAWTLTLPASPSIGFVVGVIDQDGNFATANLTIDRNSSNIMGLAEDMTCRTDNLGFELVYSGDTTDGWRIK